MLIPKEFKLVKTKKGDGSILPKGKNRTVPLFCFLFDDGAGDDVGDSASYR